MQHSLLSMLGMQIGENALDVLAGAAKEKVKEKHRRQFAHLCESSPVLQLISHICGIQLNVVLHTLFAARGVACDTDEIVTAF